MGWAFNQASYFERRRFIGLSRQWQGDNPSQRMSINSIQPGLTPGIEQSINALLRAWSIINYPLFLQNVKVSSILWCYIRKVVKYKVFKFNGCQSSKLENFHLKFIYRISYKIAKRQTLEKRISPIGNCRYAIRAKMSDRSELGSDCIQLLSILDLKASFMFWYRNFSTKWSSDGLITLSALMITWNQIYYKEFRLLIIHHHRIPHNKIYCRRSGRSGLRKNIFEGSDVSQVVRCPDNQHGQIPLFHFRDGKHLFPGQTGCPGI